METAESERDNYKKKAKDNENKFKEEERKRKEAESKIKPLSLFEKIVWVNTKLNSNYQPYLVISDSFQYLS